MLPNREKVKPNCRFPRVKIRKSHASAKSKTGTCTNGRSLKCCNDGDWNGSDTEKGLIKGYHGIGINMNWILFQSAQPVGVTTGTKGIVASPRQYHGIDVYIALNVIA